MYVGACKRMRLETQSGSVAQDPELHRQVTVVQGMGKTDALGA